VNHTYICLPGSTQIQLCAKFCAPALDCLTVDFFLHLTICLIQNICSNFLSDETNFDKIYDNFFIFWKDEWSNKNVRKKFNSVNFKMDVVLITPVL
jgi:hypothetical protein